MPYCKQCGAYIPDGQIKCLACGFDESEMQGGEYAYARLGEKTELRRQEEKTTDQQRAEVEQRRQQRREFNKTWAENEQRQRRMEEEFQRRRNMEDEFKRRAKETEQRVEETVNRAVDSARSTVKNASDNNSARRWLSAACYFGPLCILGLILNDDDFTKFHAKQGLKLFILYLIGNFFWPLVIPAVFLTLKGVKNALEGKKEPLPFIGNKF